MAKPVKPPTVEILGITTEDAILNGTNSGTLNGIPVGTYTTSLGGTFSITSKSWSYVPPSSLQGLDETESANDTFTVKGKTYGITVNGLNDAPIGVADSFTT